LTSPLSMNTSYIHILSLLVVVLQDQETTRFTMREPLRGYSLQQLDAAGEDDIFHARHREWCLTLAERAPAGRIDADQVERLGAEQANLRAALRWALESDQAAVASRLAVGLAPLWLVRGHFAEGRALLTAAAQLPSAEANPVPASQACSWAAVFAYNEGAYAVVQELGSRALTLTQGAGDESALVEALT
jgi:hypothetical protein